MSADYNCIVLAEVAVEKTVCYFDKCFDYIVPSSLYRENLVGCRVTVPFGKGNVIRQGMIMNMKSVDMLKTNYKAISSVIDTVCFDGNGYSDEWKEEAGKRGLDVETSVPKMFSRFTLPQSIEMFTSTGVYSEKELVARNEVKLETYIKKVQIEARVMGRMAINHVIPAAVQYETSLLKEIALRKDIFGEVREDSTETVLVGKISCLIEDVRSKVEAMKEARKKANAVEDIYCKALAYQDIADSLPGIRRPIDKLEEIVDNRLWPLPKYRELLFIS